MKLVRRLLLSALKYNIHFRSKHIPWKTNIVCDRLSCFLFQEALQIAPWLSPTPVNIAFSSFDIMSNKFLNASLSAATRSSYDMMVKTYVSFCKKRTFSLRFQGA